MKTFIPASLLVLFSFSARSQCSASFSYTAVTCESIQFAPDTIQSPAYYQWYFGDGSSGTGSTITHAYAYDGTYYVTLTIIDSLNNCTNSFTSWVTIQCDTTVADSCDATFTYNYASCNSVWFEPVFYTSASAFSWSFGDGMYSNAAVENHVYGTNGTYPVTLTLIDSLNNCVDTLTQWVTIWCDSTITDTCDAQFSFDYLSCDSVWFTPFDYSTTANYMWDFGDGSVSGNFSDAHHYAADGIYPVTLTVMDSLTNCWNSVTNWVTIACDTTVTDSCNAQFSYYFIGCDSVIFEPVFYSPSATYTWNFGDGSVATGSWQFYTYTSNGTYPVTLTMIDSLNNCWNTVTQLVTVWCDSIPADSCNAQFDFNYMNCYSVSFTPVDYSSTTTYEWDFGDGSFDYGASTTHLYATDGTYPVTLTVMDSLTNCWNAVTNWVTIACDTTVIDSCSAAFDYSFVTCDSAWFTPAAYNPSATYFWEFGDGTVSTDPFASHIYAANGTYAVTLTAMDSVNNCWATETSWVTVWCDSTISCSADFTYEMLSCDSIWVEPVVYSPSATYTWNFGDGTMSWNAFTMHHYAVDGVYAVTLTVFDSLGSCWDITTQPVVVDCDSSFLQIEETATQGIHIYPNPGTGIFYVEIPSENTTIRIYDMAGNNVLDIVSDNNNVFTLDLTHLANGTYNVILISESRTETRKIIKN